MKKNLDKIRIIDASMLCANNYFQSLLEQALNVGLLNVKAIERMQYECLNLLAYQTERFNAGLSSSIRVEKAQDILASILFTISIWLKTVPNPDDAIAVLQAESIHDIYKKGRKRIDKLLIATKSLHTKLCAELIDTPNIFYQSTLRDAILGFFKLYYPDFSAKEIHITADYPLIETNFNLDGIEFIKTYVTCAYYENKFCSYFHPDDIHHLLCGYVADYKERLFNIYEQVLIAAIGCIITGKGNPPVHLTNDDVQCLSKLLTGQPKSSILSILSNATDQLNTLYRFSSGLYRYVINSLPILAAKIDSAAQEHTLKRLFIVPVFPENTPKLIFSYGDKMLDEQYRKVVAEIGQCRFLKDKIAIIKQHIHSLADLEDVLLDVDLTIKEMQDILQSTGLQEIAALSKRYLFIDTDAMRYEEKQLQEALQCCISALTPVKRQLIEQIIKALQDE